MRMDAQLARTLSARLCHDLGGAVGALAGTLDLVGEGDAELLGLARDTATALRQRLRLYAAAWGGAAADADGASLALLLEAAPAAPRVRFRLDHLAPGGRLAAALVPLALNAALLGAEALPRGGTSAWPARPRRGWSSAWTAGMPPGRRGCWRCSAAARWMWRWRKGRAGCWRRCWSAWRRRQAGRPPSRMGRRRCRRPCCSAPPDRTRLNPIFAPAAASSRDALRPSGRPCGGCEWTTCSPTS